MKRILLKSVLGHFRSHPLQAILAVIGVALGVAVFVGIEGANGSALRAFEISAQAITGRTTHQVVGESAGVPESFYRDLRVERGIRWAAPVIEGFVSLANEGEAATRLRLLGVDFFADATFRDQLGDPSGATFDLAGFLTRPGVVLSAPTAAARSLSLGDRFELRVAGRLAEVELVGVFQPENDFERAATADLALCDVATAQTLLELGEKLSRIDLVVPSGADEAPAMAAIRQSLPAGTRIVRPEQRSAAAEQMTRAFRLNLRALSLLALLCGAFLIYNTMTFAVVQRRPILGTLRALGATSRELFTVVLCEAALVGALGALIGIASGGVLARALVSRVTQTVNDLYFTVNVREVEVPAGVLAAGAALGIGAALLAALGPAAEALRAQARSALARAELEARTRRALPTMTTIGLVTAAGGAVSLALPLAGLISSFAGLFMILIGMACLAPASTVLLMRLLTPIAERVAGPLGKIAARGVAATLSRTGVAIAALMMAIAVTVGVDVMIQSFRGTVERWLAYSLLADLYVTTPGAIKDRFAASPPALGPADVEVLRALPGVARVTSVRSVRIGSDVGPIRLQAFDLDLPAQQAFRLARGDEQRAWAAFDRGEVVLISEPFSYRHDLDVGSSLVLQTPAGERVFEVAGVFYDYATEEGTVMIAQAQYRRLWSDFGADGAALYLEAGANLESVRDRALTSLAAAGIEGQGDAPGAAFGSREFAIRSNKWLREESLRVFDRTFVVTGVLRMLAILVAFVGVLAALTALQLERAREIGVLRALGTTPGEVWALVTTQTGLIGLVAGILAVPVGLTMAVIMIEVINRRSFGWSLEMTVTAAPLGSAVALSIGAALLAGLYPAFRMARTSPAEGLRGE